MLQIAVKPQLIEGIIDITEKKRFSRLHSLKIATSRQRLPHSTIARSAWVFVAVTALFGCSDAPLQESSPVVTATVSSETTDFNPTLVAESPRTDASTGGIMVVENVCRSADPAIDAASASRQLWAFPLVTEIHAGLTRLAPDAPERVDPDLAESFVVSDDGMRYEFTLRKDLKFSDGSDLQVTDVKWSWERALKKSTSWSRARGIFGAVIGAENVASGDAETLDGLTVVDERTLHVNLTRPVPEFPTLVADPVAHVLKRGNVVWWGATWTNDAFPNATFAAYEEILPDAFSSALPVGAGPFKLVSYNPTGSPPVCVLARNEHYWDDPARLDGVVFLDPSEVLQSGQSQTFANGGIDYVFGQDIGEETLKSIAHKSEQFEPPPYSWVLLLNPNYSPFDDVNHRRALIVATDLERVYAPVSVNWDQSIVPPRMSTSYEVCEAAPYASSVVDLVSNSIHADRGTAASYWTESGGTKVDRLGNLFAIWNETADLNVDIKFVSTPEELFGLLGDGLMEMRTVDISPLNASPLSVLQHMVDPFGGETSHPEWAEVKNLVEAAATEPDLVVRYDLYRDIECYLHERALVIPLLVDWADIELKLQPWVNGFAPPRFSSSAFYNVWFDDEAPRRELP